MTAVSFLFFSRRAASNRLYCRLRPLFRQGETHTKRVYFAQLFLRRMRFRVLHKTAAGFSAFSPVTRQLLQLVEAGTAMYNRISTSHIKPPCRRPAKETVVMKAFMDKDFLLETPTA